MRSASNPGRRTSAPPLSRYSLNTLVDALRDFCDQMQQNLDVTLPQHHEQQATRRADMTWLVSVRGVWSGRA